MNHMEKVIKTSGKLLWLQDKCYNMLTKDSSCFILAEYELAHFIMKTFATKMAISKY